LFSLSNFGDPEFVMENLDVSLSIAHPLKTGPYLV
jgi:hypothetical protein